jgi:uncharacterized protein (DUF433 family)
MAAFLISSMLASRYNSGMTDEAAITIDPDVQAGTPCFAGTRVPVKSLFDALNRGRSIAYFLEQFPSVKHRQVREVLRQAEQLVRERAVTAAL